MDKIVPGTPSTLPSPPFVTLEGIPNFRDIGGWPIAGQATKSVRRNRIFRCGEPTKATATDISKVKSLGVSCVFDLRSNPEIKSRLGSDVAGAGGQGAADWPGVERRFVPVFPDQSYDPVSLAASHKDYMSEDAQGMVRAYKAILEHGADAYKSVVERILGEPDSAVIVHCTAGKDRTGVLCALLLSLCGVEDAVLAEEYCLTELGLAPWMHLIVGAIMESAGSTQDAARRMAGARKESMLGFLEMLRGEYGGAEGYLRDLCGIGGEKLERLKGILVVDKEPVCGV